MPLHVVFVCLGNICRSPIAEGILRRQIAVNGLTDLLTTDSCGTAAFNIGKPPDPRAIASARAAGYDISTQIARQISDEDYQRADYLIAMDRANLMSIQAWAPASYQGDICLLMDFVPGAANRQVEDPFYSDDNRFDALICELEVAIDKLIEKLTQRVND